METMLCPKCGKDNNPFAKYCDDCGELLPEVQMELSDEGFIDENRELKVSEAAPVSDAVRSPQHIGNMPVEDLGDQETFEPQMLSFNTQAYNAAQANLGYIRPNDIPILTTPDPVDKDGFVPSSAFANLKEPKQKKSKVRIFFIVLSIMVILSIASFFAVKYIIETVSTKFMREHTSQFVVNAYQLSAKELIESEELIRIFSPENNKSGTIKNIVTKKNQSIITVSSFDRSSNRLYYSLSTKGTKNDMSIEAFANLKSLNMKYVGGENAKDYYIPLENLRETAKTSALGYQGENIFNITPEQYDSIMDVYEFVYKFLQLSDEEKETQSSLKKLYQKICDDIDSIAETEIKDEQVSVEGSEKSSVYLITRTLSGKDVLNVIYTDLKEWTESSDFLKGEVKTKVMSYIEKLNDQSTEFVRDMSALVLKIEDYINKSDNSLMQTVINAVLNGEKSETRIYFGTSPAESDKIIITTNAIKAKENDDPNQSSAAEANKSATSMIEISREKTTLNNTYTLLYSTPDSEAKYVLVRDNSNGKYSLESTVKASATSEPVVTTSEGVIKFDSVTFSWTLVSDDATTEYYYSTLPEMNEISSNENMLTATADDIQNFFESVIGSLFSILLFGGL